MFFGLWEHLTSYPSEPPIVLMTRVAAHTGYACTAFAICLFLWRSDRHPVIGVWVGTIAGMVPHSLFNLGPVAPANWPVHEFAYTFVMGLATFFGSLLLLRRILDNEPGSDPARLLSGVQDADPRA
jgi:hypothetical protein